MKSKQLAGQVSLKEEENKDNLIGKDEALKKLQYYKPNHQICIINQEIIDKYLKYKEYREV